MYRAVMKTIMHAGTGVIVRITVSFNNRLKALLNMLIHVSILLYLNRCLGRLKLF